MDRAPRTSVMLEALASKNNLEWDMRLIIDGLTFAEGPRWRDGELWFSDLQPWQADEPGRVMAVNADGVPRTVLEHVPGGPPSGLGCLSDGRLLVVVTQSRQLLALSPDGTLSRYADLSGVASSGATT